MSVLSRVIAAVAVLAAAGFGIGIAIERGACHGLEQANRGLREQLSTMDDPVADNQPLSSLTATPGEPQLTPPQARETSEAADGRAGELVRLRGEVESLRQQSKELERLREDTRQVRETKASRLQARNASSRNGGGNAMASGSAQFEILSAEYWTANTNMDLAAELGERIRDNRLRTMAGNNIKGDPEFGQVKRLTVVYRAGGITRTNEFREGDVVILPPPE